MKVTFLGTGTSQGIPVIGSDHPVCFSKDPKDKRLRVSIAVEWGDNCFVVDCGPDFRYQMLRANIKKVDGIFFTHEHADHVAGLDDIRPFVFRQGKMPIYGHQRVISNLIERFAYIFETENRYPGAPRVTPNIIDDEPFTLGGIKVVPVNVMHRDLQVYGYRFKDFAYITDAKTIKEEEIAKLKELDVLVINALRKEPHYSHLNLEEALELISLLEPKNAYLTHVSHTMGFHEEVQHNLPANVYLAYDNLQIHI